MQRKFFVALTVLIASTAVWLSSHAVILPPPATKKITLSWDYPETDSQIVFNIYETTDLSVPMNQWNLVTNVTERSCTLSIQDGCHFFTVSASNTLSGLESAFAGTDPQSY